MVAGMKEENNTFHNIFFKLQDASVVRYFLCVKLTREIFIKKVKKSSINNKLEMW